MIDFESVTKIFPNGTHAVNNLSLEIQEGETLVLLGTSGSGKTTTMKMVNRLIEPTHGEIKIDGIDIMNLNPFELRRNIGYAIQHIGLFPHMTIAQNISVVPQLLHWEKTRIKNRIDELLNLVGLSPSEFRERYPNQLSGGQRQRIGVARALAANPPIILMDEPFGALDPITREELQNEFIDLKSKINKTTIFVTHDVYEAIKLADRIAILCSGELQQVDTPRKIVENPINQSVDQFLGKHHFQLSLLTSTVKYALMDKLQKDQKKQEKRPSIFITPQTSIIDALDLFKKERIGAIPVYTGNDFLGVLEKSHLLQAIVNTFLETGKE